MNIKTFVNRFVLLKIALLLGFSLFFLVIILTGTVSLYVHPRIEPYLIFASAVMALIALLMLPRLKSHSDDKKSPWLLIAFAVPLFLTLILPPQPMGSASVSTSDLLAANPSVSASDSAQPVNEANVPVSEQTQAQVIPTAKPVQPEIPESQEADSGADEGQTLLVTNDNFYDVLNALYDDMDDYLGRRIEMTGFVFFDPENFSADQFVPARLLMTCCAADMVAVGVLCRYDDAATLEEDSWVKVTGIVSATNFLGETVPSIEVESVRKTTPPDDEYIYPY